MATTFGPIQDFAAGGLAGWSGLCIGHPLDTLKVKLQITEIDMLGNLVPSTTKKMSEAFAMMNKEGMINGHFRGFLSPFVSYGLLNAVYFGVYGNVLTFLDDRTNASSSLISKFRPNYFNIFLAGCAGGFVQTIPGCPFELTKVVLQSQVGNAPGLKYYKGPVEALFDIVRKNGLMGCYRGFLVHNIRDIPSCGVYSLSYEFFCYRWKNHYPRVSGDVLNFVAGGLTGVISWLIILPIDVIKNRIQADCHKKLYRNIWHCTRATYREGGIPLFFKGWVAVSIRAFLVNSITLMVYSYIKNNYRKKRH
ncbi:solute carrier family 25 member 45 [Octopus bimaculoides]|uniref:Solute carrier family 25 member 45 n=1 Tax=Octopus bimaculoides TaxID=37653 RepID=A0A0L8GSE9_OCTBM|nr:solute carrier family 25 member 45 [Octopus bimaculoides]|eukprot:XP_014778510.1 PREDICTED: solute carrier family 25 member 45-like [Octopus bimaculoides]